MSEEAPLLVPNRDREKVVAEIAQCQARVIQTMVPTILALGLLAVADPKNIGGITLGCAFAVLFCSSLYVASLSHKIFVNGGFLAEFPEHETREGHFVHWERAIGKYRERYKWFPFHTETTTAATIYVVLALTFFFMFHKENLVASGICTAILLTVALIIFRIYFTAHIYRQRWQQIRKELEQQVSGKGELQDAERSEQ